MFTIIYNSLWIIVNTWQASVAADKILDMDIPNYIGLYKKMAGVKSMEDEGNNQHIS